jgi:hypothetical protein
MLLQDLMFTLQVIVDGCKPKTANDCVVNPPCGCANPGKELQCENCEHLEACLSRFQPVKFLDNKVKVKSGQRRIKA